MKFKAKSIILCISSFLFLFLSQVNLSAQVIFDTPGIYQWTVPPCVYEITVEVYGGGGGGGGAIAIMRSSIDSEACAGGGGGGGGGFTSHTFSVIPGETYTVIVGAGGGAGDPGNGSYGSGITTQPTAGGTGETSSFTDNGINLVATGGIGGGPAGAYNNNNSNDVNGIGDGGIGGTGSGGTLNHTGGSGASGHILNFSTDKSGGGGGAAGPGGNGGNAENPVTNGINNPQGGTGQSPGGNGGSGKMQNQPFNVSYDGGNGLTYGGAGGGGLVHRESYNVQRAYGGTGANGAVLIYYDDEGASSTPEVSIISPTCTSDGFALISNYNGTEYIYYFTPDGPSVASDGTILNVNFGQEYTVIATPVDGGCSSEESEPFTAENQYNTPVVNAGDDIEICQGEEVTLTAEGASTYFWDNGLGNGSSHTVSPTTGTTYTVEGTNDEGCLGVDEVTITVHPAPVLNVTSDETICIGESVTLIVSGADSYTWSPEVGLSSTIGNSVLATPTETTTYTVIGETNGCQSTSSVTITVEDIVEPSFELPNSICLGTSFTLPATSIEGISGNWSPDPDFTNTTDYTFVPNSQCASTVSITVEVVDNSEPIFVNPGPICDGETYILPNISDNLIEGSWFPTPDFNQTMTYTFTPINNQCAQETTMTVEVANEVEPLFTNPGPYCEGETFVLPSLSNNSIEGVWSPSPNFDETTIYTFTPNSGSSQCAVPTTMTIEILPSITPDFEPQNPICEGEIFTFPTQSLNGINGAWSPEFNSVETTTYTFTPDQSQCATTASLEVIVNPITLPYFSQFEPICEGENLILPTVSENLINGSWSPTPNPNETTEYTFIPNADDSQCILSVTMTVEVILSIVPTFSNPGPICEGESFVLPTVSENAIIGTWTPTPNFNQTTTYTFTPDFGISQCTEAIIMTVEAIPSETPIFSIPESICEGETLTLPTTSLNGVSGTWSPEPNSTETTSYLFTPDFAQCTEQISVTVVVNQNEVPIFDLPVIICQGEELVLPTQSLNGIQGTWSPDFTSETTTTYTFTPESNQCVSIFQTEINIKPTTSLNLPQLGPICAGGSVDFPQSSLEGIPGTWNPSFNNMSTTTYTFIPSEEGCYENLTTTVVVYPPPNVDASADQTIYTGQEINIFATGADYFVWDNGLGAGDSHNVAPVETTVYTVVGNSGNCYDTAQVIITVLEDFIFYVPNTFTPDGDNYNQIFKPIFSQGYDPLSYTLFIFNRWGELIFESHNVDIGWNGSYLMSNNELCPDGVYIWKILIGKSEVKEVISRVGHVTLIR